MDPQLYPVQGTENPDRRCDVIFVHGLNGDPISTWQYKDDESFWPRWLGRDCPDLGVWTVYHDAPLSEWQGRSAVSRFDQALKVLDLLHSSGVDRRPLCFVAHSLGGLLVKHLLRLSSDVGNRYQAFSQQTCGVAFLATPHTGSDAVALARYLGGLLRRTITVEELARYDAGLLELNRWFRSWAANKRLPLAVYYEEQRTYGVQIVDRGSADPGIPGTDPIGVDADHFAICKPASPQANVYLGVRAFVRAVPLASVGTPGSPAAPSSPEQPVAVPQASPTRDAWYLVHEYPMPPHFTGRAAERALMTHWLREDTDHPLLVLRAHGGFGKSALAWHWLLHDVDPAQQPQVVWWSFYESGATFSRFLHETLAALSSEPDSRSPRQQADALLHLLRQPGVLLVLDGFERSLRAYGSGLDAAYQGDASATMTLPGHERDCVDPTAEYFLRRVAVLPDVRSKVLLTTRLLPRTLEAQGGELLVGCREEEIVGMDPADAVAFCRARGILGSDAELIEASAYYGYHPLSLRVLVGRVIADNGRDIAAARDLDVSDDLVQRRTHVLEFAYNGLTPARRELLGRIACFRGAVDRAAMRTLAPDVGGDGFDGDVRDLLSRDLLQQDSRGGRFDLHPIVRHFAYARLGADARRATHDRLRTYFWTVDPYLASAPIERLDDLAPTIELFHHMTRAGLYDGAYMLYTDRINQPLHYEFGNPLIEIDLLRAFFPDGEDAAPRLTEEREQSGLLHALGVSYSLIGQSGRAIPLLARAADIDERLGDEYNNLATSLLSLAEVQIRTGQLQSAEGNLRRSIARSREQEDGGTEASARCELGMLLAHCGRLPEATTELVAAGLFGDGQLAWSDLACRAQWSLLLARHGAPGYAAAALSAATSASAELAYMAHLGQRNEPAEVMCRWVEGAAQFANGDLAAADELLSRALLDCRTKSLGRFEADILLDMARVQAQAGARGEARRLANEALTAAVRTADVRGEAEIRLLLARLASQEEDAATAQMFASEARQLARADGSAKYIYRLVYDEATALLARLPGDIH